MIGRRHEGGFSLIEVLMAIIILAIGMISIAALFPAGIAQQRQSVDDVMGPVVANNALAVLRSKLRPEDFGLGSGYTIDGDFAWSRPAFFTTNTTLHGGLFVPAGSISVFNGSITNTTDSELELLGLWNTDLYGGTPPTIIINQAERYYPMGSVNSTNPFPPKPQYVWDCMFRRFQGRVQVALFVYRVAIPGGGTSSYTVAQNPPPNADVPPVPFSVVLAVAGYPFWVANEAVIDGTPGGTPYDASDATQSWQEPRQWLLDQNNNIHRVLSRFVDEDESALVELTRPIPSVELGTTNLFIYDPFPALGDLGLRFENVVTDVWYIPAEIQQSSDGPLLLTPVYLTVREL